MGSMEIATEGFERLRALKALAMRLATEIDFCEDPKLMAGLARQYRETMAEIDAIESGGEGDDEIAAIILRNRKSGAD